MKGIPLLAYYLFKNDSISMYNCPSTLFTINNESIEDLNEKGWEEYNKVLALVNEGKFNGVITNHEFYGAKSGSLWRDKNSKHFNPEDLNYLNTWSNTFVHGIMNNKEINTSIVQFLSKEGKWVYTVNGSLYQTN